MGCGQVTNEVKGRQRVATFSRYIGIDYSGAKTPKSRLKGLQVYAARAGEEPRRIDTHVAPEGQRWNWTRREIAEWLIARCRAGGPFIAGIDHAFSFPQAYFEQYDLVDWDAFLADFIRHWPTREDHAWVESCRENNARAGRSSWFRLTERWTSSAKSVFHFDVQGQVAKSSHAGIPWLQRIRQETGDAVHFWPFDGWDVPPGRSAIVEVYPSIFRKRYPKEGLTTDEQDAYATARWLRDADTNSFLDRYFCPALREEDRLVAAREGWILGIA